MQVIDTHNRFGASLSAAERELILGKTAARLLNL